jgi:hypothetical protein
MSVNVLGEAQFPSPLRPTVSDDLRVPEQVVGEPKSPALLSIFAHGLTALSGISLCARKIMTVPPRRPGAGRLSDGMSSERY